MRICLNERQFSYIKNFIIEQEIENNSTVTSDTTSATATAMASSPSTSSSSSSSSSSEGGSDKPSYPPVSKWESGVSRGAGNQIDLTTWEDVVGSKLNRGKANQLNEQETTQVQNKPMPIKTPWGATINIPEGSSVTNFTDDMNLGELFAKHDENGIAIKKGTEYLWSGGRTSPDEQTLHSLLPSGTVAYFETPNEGHLFKTKLKYDAVKTRFTVLPGYFRDGGGVSQLTLPDSNNKQSDGTQKSYLLDIQYKEEDYIPYYKEKSVDVDKLLKEKEYKETENKNIKISTDNTHLLVDLREAHSNTDIQEATIMIRNFAFSWPGIIIQVLVTVFTDGAAILPIEIMNAWFLLNDISILIDNGINPAPPTNTSFKEAFLWLWRNNEDVRRFTEDLFIVAVMGIGTAVKALGGFGAIGAKIGAFIEEMAPEVFLNWFKTAMNGLKSALSAIVQGAGNLLPQAVIDFLNKALEFIGVAQEKLLAYGAKGTIQKMISYIPKATIALAYTYIGVETFNWLINYLIPPATEEEKAKELSGMVTEMVENAKNGDRTKFDDTMFNAITNTYPDIERSNFKSSTEIYNGHNVFIINGKRCIIKGQPPTITKLR